MSGQLIVDDNTRVEVTMSILEIATIEITWFVLSHTFEFGFHAGGTNFGMRSE